MALNNTEIAPTLPGLEPEPAKPDQIGPVEAGILRQIEKLTSDGYITDHHAGQVALAVRAAQDVDESRGQGLPSGRANLLRAMREILEDLPQPEAGTGDALDRALEAILQEG